MENYKEILQITAFDKDDARQESYENLLKIYKETRNEDLGLRLCAIDLRMDGNYDRTIERLKELYGEYDNYPWYALLIDVLGRYVHQGITDFPQEQLKCLKGTWNDNFRSEHLSNLLIAVMQERKDEDLTLLNENFRTKPTMIAAYILSKSFVKKESYNEAYEVIKKGLIEIESLDSVFFWYKTDRTHYEVFFDLLLTHNLNSSVFGGVLDNLNLVRSGMKKRR